MKRFYKTVSVIDEGSGWQVALDNRVIRTTGGRAQIMPSRALAEGLAGEWSDQGEEIDASRFVWRDLADYALDMVAQNRAGTIKELLAYAETDTLCYRAEPDEPLYARQIAVWEPVLQNFENLYGLRLERVSGIMHRAQPVESLARITQILERANPFTLSALHTLASLAASLTLALLTLENGAETEALWAAACLEEQWQVEQWGSDIEAETRRQKRRQSFLAAAQFALLAIYAPLPPLSYALSEAQP